MFNRQSKVVLKNSNSQVQIKSYIQEQRRYGEHADDSEPSATTKNASSHKPKVNRTVIIKAKNNRNSTKSVDTLAKTMNTKSQQ